MKSTFLAHAACALAVLAAALPAAAQLTNCARVSQNPGDYKIVLDEFSFATDAAKNDAGLAALEDTFQFNFAGQLDELKDIARREGLREVRLILVTCDGRKPALAGGDFTQELVENLSDLRVVVEMWASLELRAVAGAPPTPRITLGFVMPPVKHYQPDARAAPPILVRYPKAGAGPAPEELENLPELTALAMIGLGTKATRALDYDQAMWAYRVALGKLHEAQLGGAQARLLPLVDYVEGARCDTAKLARRDVRYQGALKLGLPPGCGGAP